jgi:ATP-binding cassette subfamily B protein
VLERVRIVEQGRHEDLIERKGLYYAMWRQQIGERRYGDLDATLAEAVGSA